MVWLSSYYYFNDEMLTILTGGSSVTLIYIMCFQFKSERFILHEKSSHLNDLNIVKIYI